MSFTNQTKNSASYTDQAIITAYSDFLLLETGDYLLQETGDNLILEQSTASKTSYTNQSKN